MASETTTMFDEMKADIAKLRADLKRLQKVVRKLTKPPEDESKPKKLSGFAKPMKLSNELTTFLGVPTDTMLARTDVTKEINKYVKENNLQNPDNKRELILDAKLRTIIKTEADETVTFFNLQRFMSPHYIKEDAPPAPDTPPAPPPVAVEEPKKVIKKVVKKIVRPVGTKA